MLYTDNIQEESFQKFKKYLMTQFTKSGKTTCSLQEYLYLRKNESSSMRDHVLICKDLRKRLPPGTSSEIQLDLFTGTLKPNNQVVLINSLCEDPLKAFEIMMKHEQQSLKHERKLEQQSSKHECSLCTSLVVSTGSADWSLCLRLHVHEKQEKGKTHTCIHKPGKSWSEPVKGFHP